MNKELGIRSLTGGYVQPNLMIRLAGSLEATRDHYAL